MAGPGLKGPRMRATRVGDDHDDYVKASGTANYRPDKTPVAGSLFILERSARPSGEIHSPSRARLLVMPAERKRERERESR